MSIKAVLWDSASGSRLHTSDPLVAPEDGPLLITGTQGNTHGTFKTATVAAATTTVIVTPLAGGSIVLTDLMITGAKSQNNSIIVQMTDGTQTEQIAEVSTDVAPVLAIAFQGLWRGWKDARLEMVTSGTPSATVAVGYFKSIEAIAYAQWDALR